MFCHIVLLVGLLARPAGDGPHPPEAKLIPGEKGEPATVDLIGVNSTTLTALRTAALPADELAKFCRVVVATGSPAEIGARPAVAGTWSVTADAIRYRPQFPLVPGVPYLITCRLHDIPVLKPRTAGFSLTLTIPRPPPGPPTSVSAVYPSGDRFPENTLRFYVHFSGPMTHGDIYRHLKLIRDDGVEVPSPFLEIDEELWSPDGLRVTLLFHPGRVKSGLVPREELGPILEAGRRYTLIIDPSWKDADGRPLAAAVRKTFSVGPPDDEPVDPTGWALIPPQDRSTAPVILRLAKPLDRALLGSMIGVVDAAGQRVVGEITVGGGERVVTFAPTGVWKAGAYKLVVDPRLEDVCGNRVGEPFEIDPVKLAGRDTLAKTIERAFAVR